MNVKYIYSKQCTLC